MKMDIPVSSPAHGKVLGVTAKAGATVKPGDLLAIVAAGGPAAARAPAGTGAEAASKGATLQATPRAASAAPAPRSDRTAGGAGVWASEVATLQAWRATAREHGGAVAVKRQHDGGKLTARERLAALLDKDSFVELGSLAGAAEYAAGGETGGVAGMQSFVPANNVGGQGKIEGRHVVASADDFTVRGGHADGGIMFKSAYFEKLARRLRLPIVRLLDGSSGGGSVATLLKIQATYVPMLPGFEHMVPMLGEVPIVAALLGPVVGLAAARAVMTHFSVMVTGTSSFFAAGPPVVRYATFEDVTKDVLGGPDVHGANGSIDNVAASETDAFDQIRRFLSFLPSSAWELPARTPCADSVSRRDERLLSVVPRDRRIAFDIREVISMIFDLGSFFEVGRNWGREVVVGFARLDGFPVGVLAADSTVNGGVLGADAARKLRRHVDTCDLFHLPVVSLLDQPGFAVGTVAEKESTVRHGASALAAIMGATVPWFTLIVRRCFGVAGAMFADAGSPPLRVAWPSADWGSLPFEGGVEAAYSRQLAAAKDPEAMRARLLEEFEALRSPLRTAAIFGVEEIIDPRDTRPMLCSWAALAYDRMAKGPAPVPRPGGYRP